MNTTALPTNDPAREEKARKLKAIFSKLQMGVELTLCHYRDYGTAQMKNVFSNFLFNHSIKKAEDLFGKFHGIPAIICGAGPSLTRHIETLKNISDRALIFGGGSA